MKVKVLKNVDNFKEGEIVEAKRFNELSEEEKLATVATTTDDPFMWDGDELFIHYKGDEWLYMYDDEVEIL